ncbi:MAG: hypothetical protein KGR26_01855 [Cyanobacteria bacterium REEB65]|nr:hypothetical protein [Cyanobacteria bacterium REEB65]
MLRELLAELGRDARRSSLEVRGSLGLTRGLYEDLLGHLIRLGYVTAAPLEATDCATEGCHGCPIGCGSTPKLGPQTLEVTPKGRAFLARGGAAVR